MGLALEAPADMYISEEDMNKTLAKKFMDALIYDNDFVNRMTPFDESRHYGDWTDKIAEKIFYPDGDNDWWDKEDRIDIFAVGDYDEMEGMVKDYPELRGLSDVLNAYFDYLEEEFKIKD